MRFRVSLDFGGQAEQHLGTWTISGFHSNKAALGYKIPSAKRVPSFSILWVYGHPCRVWVLMPTFFLQADATGSTKLTAAESIVGTLGSHQIRRLAWTQAN